MAKQRSDLDRAQSSARREQARSGPQGVALPAVLSGGLRELADAQGGPLTLQRKSKPGSTAPIDMSEPAPPGGVDPRLDRLIRPPTKECPISAPHDPAEREADAIAERVTDTLRGASPGSGVVRPSRISSAAVLPKRGTSVSAPAPFVTALKGARAGGRPLDHGFRGAVEGAMGQEFGDVRVHTDNRAHQLSAAINARAFTTGADIYFKRGEYDPTSEGGQRLISHELAHVVQQRGAGHGDAIHRVITVGSTEYAGWRIRGTSSANVQAAWKAIKATNYTPELRVWSRPHLERLTLWITRDKRYSKQFWMTQREYSFADWEEAAAALDAEVMAQFNRSDEKEYARRAKEDHPEIQANLVKAMRAIGSWIPKAFPGALVAKSAIHRNVWEFLEGFHGQYDHWYPNGHIQERLTRPVAKKVSSNFVILREAVYALNAVEYVDLKDTDEALVGTRTEQLFENAPRYGTGPHGRVRVDKEGHETRKDDFTPEPSHPWVRYARSKKMPLRAGASNTTDRILQMAAKAGVDARGKQAIAWAGFIFWNSRYYTMKAPGHTFHEVMDIANVEHNVPYNRDRPYTFTLAEEEEEAPRPQIPDYSRGETTTLLVKTKQTQQTQRTEQTEKTTVNTSSYAKIPTGALTKIVFTAGKKMEAARELDGPLNLQVRFVEEPGNDPLELPLRMHKVLCLPEYTKRGRARLEPAGFGQRAVFVRLDDLFDLDTGQIILT